MPSRILDSSQGIRESLKARNLYNPLDPYNIESSDLTKTVNLVARAISPFSTFQFSNSVVGKLVDPNSRLAEISVDYLAIQLGRTAASSATREYFPVTTLSNVFKKDAKVFKLKKDYEITRKEGQGFGRFLDNITGTNFKTSPFDKYSTNSTYIRNTGKGQLEILYEQLNRNIYKPSDADFINATKSQEFSVFNGSELFSAKPNTLITYNEYFTPFNQYKVNESLLNIAESNYKVSRISYLTQGDSNIIKPYEYGSTQQFVDDLGKTRIRDNSGDIPDFYYNGTRIEGLPNEVYKINDGGLDEDTKHQLIWGRDGVSTEYKEEVGSIDRWKTQDENATTNNPRFNNTDIFSNFGIKNGLLNYTKELLNSQGKYGMFDQTRKKYRDKDEELHFRGSPIDTRPDGTFDSRRQHNAIDQYDRFAKAIRYNGNNMYGKGGSKENSVIYDTITPKFHPMVEGDTLNNENMMFSIENLAVQVIKDKDNRVAYQVDDFNTELPLCEAGIGGGRVMWFPPYDIKLHEQSISRHESTVFLGRSEPIYTYTNSERIATLSFKLIIDYPPQAMGRNQKNNAEFFAFGDEDYTLPEPIKIGDKERKLEEVKQDLKEFDNVNELSNPDISEPPVVGFYFPNDEPKQDNDAGAIQRWLSAGYEDGFDDVSEVDGFDEKSNVDYIKYVNDEIFEDNYITKMLHPDVIDYYDIKIVGSATVLYNGEGIQGNPTKAEYNKALGFRRAHALQEEIKSLYKTIYPSGQKLLDNKFKIFSDGSDLAPNDTSTATSIPTKEAKSYRNAKLSFTRSGKSNRSITDLTPEEIIRKSELENERDELTEAIRLAKASYYTSQSCVFNKYTIDDGIIKGFQGFDNNIDKFQHVFHSQTPEDFHRRLTFLQQCTRQGHAIRKKQEDGTTFSSSNSVFGRQPVQVLRIGDFFHTKVIIDNISFDYQEAPWDLNPEGFGMQFMMADISIQMKIIGGQSLKTPVNMLQNAVSFNYYANSTFSDKGVYATATAAETAQSEFNNSKEMEEKRKELQGKVLAKVKTSKKPIENNIENP